MISAASNSNLSMSSWHPLQQFGVTLEWILDNQHCSLPPIMVQCIDFLKHPDCLDTEGIFRRAANAGTVKELVKKVNQGENISFSTNDVIIATVLLKTFFRELSHPILTYQLFESILHFSGIVRTELIAEFSWIYLIRMENLIRFSWFWLKIHCRLWSIATTTTSSTEI